VAARATWAARAARAAWGFGSRTFGSRTFGARGFGARRFGAVTTTATAPSAGPVSTVQLTGSPVVGSSVAATTVRGRDRTWLVALAAGLWGTDALLRYPLGRTFPASTLVFWEHLLALVLLAPFLPGAVRAARRLDGRQLLALLVIGAGSSALATILFTRAFALGDPVTPVVLQKLQPLVAISLAALLLGERPRRRLAVFAVPALVGAWLVAFPDPLHVGVRQLTPALLAVGAAVLWGAGTVLGRGLSGSLTARELVTLRFAIGLVAAGVAVVVLGDRLTFPLGSLPAVAGLAWIPGLLALWLYYTGLRATPASRATLAELAYPVTGAVLGAVVLGAVLGASQWTGVVVVVAAVTGLALWERHCSPRSAHR
jgi:DME family drug/metabolite transporter